MEYFDLDSTLIPADTKLRDNIIKVNSAISQRHDGLLYPSFITELSKLTKLSEAEVEAEVEEAVWRLIDCRLRLSGEFEVIITNAGT